MGRLVNQFINMTFFMGLGVSEQDKEESVRPLKVITRLLQKADVSFGYLYEEELYSGALAFDEGLDDVFKLHVERVAALFKKNNVRRVITVDPHTTNMLREVYPRFVKDFDVEVSNYLDVLAEKKLQPVKQLDEEVVIHDSCVYARYEKMIDPPRQLLSAAGITVREPELCGAATHCCGGPMESLFPADAHKVATTRTAQLKEAGNSVTAMCPICLVNLKKAAENDMEMQDISSFLEKAFLV